MNEIKIFNNPQFGDIRTAGTSEQPLFCLADVCQALGLANPRQVKKQLGDPSVCSIDVGVQTGEKADGTPAIQNRQMTFVTEPGLYKCIFQSRKKEAEVFQDWVTSEVLPSIRKTGAYAIGQQVKLPNMKELAMMVVKSEEEKEQLLLESKIKDEAIHRLEVRSETQELTIAAQEKVLKELRPRWCSLTTRCRAKACSPAHR